MSRKYVTFIAQKEEFAIPVDYVNYIELPTALTKIPNSSKSILGISTIRGNVVPLFDVNHHLFNQHVNLDSKENTARVIGVHVDDQEIGLVVEEAREIIDIDEDKIQPLKQGDRHFQVANLAEDRLVLITDPHELMNEQELEHIFEEIDSVTAAEEAKQ